MKATAISSVNIALVKYWGKRDPETNWPAVGSISMTLDGLGTETTVEFDSTLEADVFILNGVERQDAKVTGLLNRIRTVAGLGEYAHISSINTVPTASGLASSASGMSALGFAAWHAAGLSNDGLLKPGKFLDLVRIGSGSAPRSLIGGIVELNQTDGSIRQLCKPQDWPIAMVVVQLTHQSKAVSSRDGMAHTQRTSPYFQPWVQHHPEDLASARSAIARRDLETLGRVMERSTMRMHACMLAADPPLRYLLPSTLTVLDIVTELRRTGISAWATMDAGPHVKILCHAEDVDAIEKAVGATVKSTQILVTHPGEGTRLVSP
ncbi:MAG: diphosphomevalonate decarboxylase [Myxococcota bacterium]|nr:diphosphomevalonate decarboxylase [Myxococcota bacterium]